MKHTFDAEIFTAFDDGVEVEQEAQPAAPTTFTLLKYGRNPYTIDGEDGEFDLDENDAQKIVDDFGKRGKDLVVDYDHATIKKDVSSEGKAPASGWIKAMRVTPSGIEVDTSWTDKAKSHIGNKEYRYHSAVIQFDRKTKRPKAIQSVALTNHPAIHGSEALIAANDHSNKAKGAEMDQELLQFAQECAENIGKLKTVLSRAFNDLAEKAKTEEEIKAFNDAKSKMLALADDGMDMTSESESEETAEVDEIGELIKWIDGRISEMDSEKDADKIAAYEEAKKIVSEFKGAEKPEGETVIVAQETTPEASTETAPPESDVGFSDIGMMLGLSDTSDKGKIKEQIVALNDYKSRTEKFLQLQNAKSLDDLAMRIVTLEAEKRAKAVEAQTTIALSDAKVAVEKAMLLGTLVENQRAWAEDFATRDLKAFNDFIGSVPMTMRSPVPASIALSDTSKVAALSKPVARKTSKHSPEAEKIAKLFGRDPKDVYKAYDDAANVAAGDFIPPSTTPPTPAAPTAKTEEVKKKGSFTGSFE